jgi:hypothetical protein
MYKYPLDSSLIGILIGWRLRLIKRKSLVRISSPPSCVDMLPKKKIHSTRPESKGSIVVVGLKSQVPWLGRLANQLAGECGRAGSREPPPYSA